MTEPTRIPRHALAETAASYGAANAATARTKLSISLPSDLVEQVRSAASQSGTSVSGVIAAALAQAIAVADDERLEAALEAQNEENAAWAEAFAPLAARLWATIEW